MDDIDRATDMMSAALDAAVARCCGDQQLHLAIYITRRGAIKTRPAHSRASARMALPDRVFRKGLWMIIAQSEQHWRIVEQQFDCLEQHAAQQFADHCGQNWLQCITRSMQAHPAGRALATS